ncbi:MAG: hypothetical protein AMJ43_04400 [Coxiella sp. DG_40]|nr:MAG: hypothetical protein AMJ43_04400 [Coxiella sp. DG_40]
MPKKQIQKTKDSRVIVRVWEADTEWGEVGHVSLETCEIYASFWPQVDPHKGNPGFFEQRRGVAGFNMPHYIGDLFLESIRRGKYRDFNFTAQYFQPMVNSLQQSLPPPNKSLSNRDLDQIMEPIIQKALIEFSKKGELGSAQKEIRYPKHIYEFYSLDVEAINNAFREFRESNCNWAIWGSSFFRSANTRNCSGLVAFLLYRGGISNLLNNNAMLVRKVGMGIGGIASFAISLPDSLGAKNLPAYTDKILLLIVGVLLGAAVGGCGGGLIDGYKDGLEVGTVAEAAKIGYSPLNYILSFLVGTGIGGTASFFGYDNVTHTLITLPGHLANLCKDAKKREERIYDLISCNQRASDPPCNTNSFS